MGDCLLWRNLGHKLLLVTMVKWLALFSNVFLLLLLILVTAIGGRPKLELSSSPGRLRWTLLPRRATAIHSVAVARKHNLPVERRTIYHWAITAPLPPCFRFWIVFLCTILLYFNIMMFWNYQVYSNKNQSHYYCTRTTLRCSFEIIQLNMLQLPLVKTGCVMEHDSRLASCIEQQ